MCNLEYFEMRQKKNKLFLILFSLLAITYTLVAILLHYGNMGIYLYTLVSYLALNLLLFFRFSSGKWTPYLLFISLNLYILLVNILHEHAILLVYFIYPIYIAVLYHTIVPRLILFLLTTLEIWALVYWKYSNSPVMYAEGDLIVFIVFLCLLVTTSILSTLYDKRFFKDLSDKNSSMQRELNSRESYLQLFFDNAKDSIAVFDIDNKIIEVNPAFEELYGWKREEVIGKRVNLSSPAYRMETEARRREVLKGASYIFLETKDMRKDGSFFDAQTTFSPIYNYEKELVAISVISRDVSFKKETETLLLQAEKLKLAGEMAAGVAHEIRNPITVISGFIQIMNTNSNQPYYHYTQIIENEIERINFIISEFLVLAKPHAKLFKKYNFTKTLNDILILFQPEINLKGIVFSTQLTGRDIYLFGEESQMKQVLINLLKNAIEAVTENGNIHISCELDVNKVITLKITDNGVGMNQETIEKVFDPFFSTKVKGTGLGLMISEKIITEQGGNIFIESEVGKGTTVTVQLPYYDTID